MDSSLLQKFMDENELDLYEVFVMYSDLKAKESGRKYEEFYAEYEDYIGRCFVIRNDIDDDYCYVKIIGVDKEDLKFIGICCYDSYYFIRTNIGIEEFQPVWDSKYSLEQLKHGREISADEYTSVVKKVMDEFLTVKWVKEVLEEAEI